MTSDTPSLLASPWRVSDLLTINDLGGWKTLSMVQRYAHLFARNTGTRRLSGLPSRKVEPEKARRAERSSTMSSTSGN